MITSGAILGELTGGNFWQGALIGGFVAGFNHVMHKMNGESNFGDDDKKKPQRKKTTTKKVQLYIPDMLTT